MITDMSDYTRIYLKPECHAGEDTVRLWCQDDEPQPCLDGERWTPYILASEYDRLQAEYEKLVEALEEIIHPVRFMRERLEEGERLDGMGAVQLAKDASYLRDIAVAALATQRKQ